MAKTVRKKQRKPSRAAGVAAALNKTLELEGKSALRLGSDPYFKIERIPTGSLVMDRVTGGGWARGRHYECYGDESAGKSYIVYRTMALAQQRGELCAMIDPEHSFDNERYDFLGGDSNELLVSHPETGEQAVAIMMMLAPEIEEGNVGVVGIDSVTSLLSMDEKKKDPREEDRIGAQARMMSKALRRITSINEKTLFLWTNQERINVGIKFGNPKTTSGGRALRYYATGRIEFRRGTKVVAKKSIARAGKLVESDVAIGRWIQVRVEKDKSTIPGRESAFVFSFKQKRIDIASEIIMLGLEDGLIARTANGRYSYTDLDDTDWSGTERTFGKMLRQNEELQHELVTAIQDKTNHMNEETDGEDS